MSDLIDREFIKELGGKCIARRDKETGELIAIIGIDLLPSAQPERLTDDDFETIRIHLSAIKGHLCNQHRWREAEEYQRIIDRLISFATAQPQTGRWIIDGHHIQCSKCGKTMCNTDREGDPIPRNFCPNCGAYMRGEKENENNIQ